MEEIQKQMTMIYEIMGKDEFAEAITSMLWKIYSKCIEKGFAQDEAMAITLSFAKSQSSK